MALLRMRDVLKMNGKERKEKIKELKMEIIRANVTANKANAKTKEIKKAISRLLTMNKKEKSNSNKTNKEALRKE